MTGVSGMGSELIGCVSRVRFEQPAIHRTTTMITQPIGSESALSLPCRCPACRCFTLWLYRIPRSVTTGEGALTALFPSVMVEPCRHRQIPRLLPRQASPGPRWRD